MKEAVFYYKCRQCGETYEQDRINEAYALMQLIAARLNQKTVDDEPAVDRLAIHVCEGLDHGLADLVGYRVVKSGEQND